MIQPFKTESIPLDFLEALRLSMNYGFISKNDIWDWAFKNIQQNEKYDTILLELIEGIDTSKQHQLNSIIGLLREEVSLLEEKNPKNKKALLEGYSSNKIDINQILVNGINTILLFFIHIFKRGPRFFLYFILYFAIFLR